MANHVNIPNDMYMKSYRLELFPREDQIDFLNKCFNAKRYIWNWALERENEQLELFEKGLSDKNFLNMYSLDAEFTILRNNNDFLKEIPHNTGRSAIRSLCKSFQYFFYKINKRPKFKRRKDDKNPSFKTREDRMFFDGNGLRIEGLNKDDMIKLKVDTGLSRSKREKYYNAVISRDNTGRYWISFNKLEKKPLTYFEEHNIPETDVIGIDLNVKDRCVLSNGMVFKAPNIKRIEKHILQVHELLIRDHRRYIKRNPEITNLDLETLDLPISNRSKKRVVKYRKLNKKLHNIEINNIYMIANKVVKELHPKMIVMENLSNEKVNWPHYIQRQVQHFNHYTIRKTIERKAELYGIPVKIAPKKYPSSQICSNCGSIRNIGSSKTYICHNCGMRMNRDLNAAINLRNLVID